MIPHLKNEIQAAAETIKNADANDPKPRSERIAEAVMEAAGLKKSGKVNWSITRYDASTNSYTSESITSSGNVLDPATVIKAAQTIAEDKTYQLMEINVIRATNAFEVFRNHLNEKYKNSPEATTDNTNSTEPMTLTGINGRLVRIDNSEADMLNNLGKNKQSLDTDKSAYVSKQAQELGVAMPEMIKVVEQVLNSTAPTEQEYAAAQADKKTKEVPFKQESGRHY